MSKKQNKSMLDVAIAITAEAFKGKFDKAGHPYILHCIYVMSRMDQNDHDLCSIAVMHDLVEDTNYTLEDLKKLGFSQRVLEGVSIMTHDKEEPYEEYIKRVATNKDTIQIKMADLRHNTDILRIKGLSKKDFDRLEKYHKAFAYLSSLEGN